MPIKVLKSEIILIANLELPKVRESMLTSRGSSLEGAWNPQISVTMGFHICRSS